MMEYKTKKDFSINVGFNVNIDHISQALADTNSILRSLPYTLFRSIDYKTTSAMVGALFCNSLAELTDGIVNPIEKGHPDIIPAAGKDASERQLRKYPVGLEIKCTVGNIQTGANLRAGETRVGRLTGLTWQAHHREVEELLGLVWDFLNTSDKFNFPCITAAFYSDTLIEEDWGNISGTTGRNTKVTGMRVAGKKKMGVGWLALAKNEQVLTRYPALMKFSL